MHGVVKELATIRQARRRRQIKIDNYINILNITGVLILALRLDTPQTLRHIPPLPGAGRAKNPPSCRSWFPRGPGRTAGTRTTSKQTGKGQRD